MIYNTKDAIELLFLFIKGFLILLFKNLILLSMKTLNDEMFFFIQNDIDYKKKHNFLLDSDSDNISSSEDEDEDEIYENKIYDMVKFNCDIYNTLNTIKINPDKLSINNYLKTDKTYIINSFLFNVTGNAYKIIDKYNFTKKLIILYNLENSINTKSIMDLVNGYNFLYIFYKTDLLNKNEYKIIIIDLINNHEIVNKKNILFNTIIL